MPINKPIGLSFRILASRYKPRMAIIPRSNTIHEAKYYMPLLLDPTFGFQSSQVLQGEFLISALIQLVHNRCRTRDVF